ncbi:MAG: M23 family metallopeptidase [Bacteroidota bacterium]|nr:M23 family metallopeptidase [Bacteroidota bacterium]
MKLRLLFTLQFVFIATIIKAQIIKLYHETTTNGFAVYADNAAPYPTSVALNLELTNLYFSEGGKRIFVIPAASKRVKIGELKVADSFNRYTFNYKFISTMGDVTITNYDKQYQYDLPFQKGTKFKLHQGYNGEFSHQNENALDFTMPEGTEILAARDGVVVQIEKNNTEACPREECSKYNNYIVVMHADGTFARYAHIQHNGTLLSVGNPVKKGDVIASSGNVGWSSGPHLHFVCFLAGFGKSNSLETQFKVDDGSKVISLQPGNFYSRGY